ncbi:MAG: hypothetical protein WCP10_12910 [Desulfuromonadales bacterium]
MSVTEILPPILSFLFGMLVLYLTAYSKAKGKNKALQEDVSKLEDEKQKVLAKYMTEMEWIKKQHALDIEKRKYLYDEKRQQFVKYFALLDEFHRKSNAIFTSQFQPIMNRFLASYLVTDETAKNNAILEFNREVHLIFNQLYEEQLKVNTETNSIRLISSDTMDELLDKLESAIKKSTDDASEMLKFMATPEFWADQSLIMPLQQKSENTGQLVLTRRNAVRSRMKIELNEI